MWPIRVRGESQWGKPFHYHKQITEYYYRQAVCVQEQRMGAKGYLINDREGATLDLCWPLNSLLQPNLLCFMEGLPSGSVIKNPSAYAGDASSIPGLVRSSGKENGNPLQFSCLGNPINRGAWRGYSPWGHKESLTHTHTHTHTHTRIYTLRTSVLILGKLIFNLAWCL